MDTGIGTPGTFPENAPFLPEKCCNYRTNVMLYTWLAFVLCATPSMEKRKKSQELSEDLRSKIVEKYQQSQGHKSISRDIKVPLPTVRNIIKKFITHRTAANLPGSGRKRKIDERMQRRIV